MAVNLKMYLYTQGTVPTLDVDFDAAKSFGKVKAGAAAIFWKSGFRRYCVSVAEIQQIFRRVEPVYGKLCCGGRSYFIEWLVLVLRSGEELVIHIGDDIQKDAEGLLAHLQKTHPNLQYGKV